MVVRNPPGHPGRPDLLLADADDLELPDLVLVGHRQAFPAVAVSVLLGQGAHEADGIPGIVAALERHPFELFDGKPSGAVHERVRTAEGGFPDGELFLVEAGIGRVEVGVGMGRLGDLAHELHARGVAAEFRLHGSAEDRVHRSRLMVGGRLHLDPGAVAAVAGVRGDDRSVGGGLAAHHDGRTALARILFLGGKREDEDEGYEDGQESSHGVGDVCL